MDSMKRYPTEVHLQPPSPQPGADNPTKKWLFGIWKYTYIRVVIINYKMEEEKEMMKENMWNLEKKKQRQEICLPVYERRNRFEQRSKEGKKNVLGYWLESGPRLGSKSKSYTMFGLLYDNPNLILFFLPCP